MLTKIYRHSCLQVSLLRHKHVCLQKAKPRGLGHRISAVVVWDRTVSSSCPVPFA